MWTCIKCNTVNEDLYTVCPKCGASRSAGRFGSGAPSAKPAVMPVQAKAAPAAAAAEKAPAPQPVYYEPDLSKIRAGRGVRALGCVLMVLLPLLCILYFIAQYDLLHTTISGLLLPASAKLPPFVSLIAYIIAAAAATLLCALPGVWTLSLGKALHRLACMEELL